MDHLTPPRAHSRAFALWTLFVVYNHRMTRTEVETLFRGSYDALCRYAVRLGHDSLEAEDIAQDIFVDLLERHGEIRAGAAELAWLYAAVRHASQNLGRHGKVRLKMQERTRHVDETPGMANCRLLPDAHTEERAMMQAVDDALQQLAPRCRETFLLHRDSGMTYAEVGTVLGVSEKTVKTQIARALHALRQQLAVWFEPDSVARTGISGTS